MSDGNNDAIYVDRFADAYLGGFGGRHGFNRREWCEIKPIISTGRHSVNEHRLTSIVARQIEFMSLIFEADLGDLNDGA